LKIFNGFLYACNLWFGISLIFLCLNAKNMLRETSISVYGSQTPLMGSNFLEAATSIPVAIIIVVLALGVALKSLIIKDFNTLMIINLSSFIALGIIASLYTYFIFLPTLSL